MLSISDLPLDCEYKLFYVMIYLRCPWWCRGQHLPLSFSDDCAGKPRVRFPAREFLLPTTGWIVLKIFLSFFQLIPYLTYSQGRKSLNARHFQNKGSLALPWTANQSSPTSSPSKQLHDHDVPISSCEIPTVGALGKSPCLVSKPMDRRCAGTLHY